MPSEITRPSEPFMCSAGGVRFNEPWLAYYECLTFSLEVQLATERGLVNKAEAQLATVTRERDALQHRIADMQDNNSRMAEGWTRLERERDEAQAKAIEECLSAIQFRRELLHLQYEALDISREDAVYGICTDALRSLNGGSNG